VPILVSRPILDSVGVVPEEDIQEATTEAGQETGAPPSEINEENLSVFKDFLSNLDIDDEDKGGQEGDEEQDKPP
jgi:hypothetical protein